jgi:hypothetical protein
MNLQYLATLTYPLLLFAFVLFLNFVQHRRMVSVIAWGQGPPRHGQKVYFLEKSSASVPSKKRLGDGGD